MRLIYIFFAISMLFVSCSNNTTQKYNIKLKLIKGTKYYFNTANISSSTFTVNDKKIETSNNTETGFIYELVKDSAGLKQFKLTYDKFKATIKKDKEIQEIDFENVANETSPEASFINKLKGASIFLNLDKNNKIVSIVGFKELTDSLLTALKISDENTKQQMKQQFSALIGEDLIKNNFEQSFVLFPDSAINTGAKWQNQNTQLSQLNIALNTNFCFTKTNENIAFLESDAIINTDNCNVNVMGRNIAAKLSGKHTGSYKININNGLVIESKLKTNIEGNMQAMGKDIPITIETSTSTTSRKL